MIGIDGLYREADIKDVESGGFGFDKGLLSKLAEGISTFKDSAYDTASYLNEGMDKTFSYAVYGTLKCGKKVRGHFDDLYDSFGGDENRLKSETLVSGRAFSYYAAFLMGTEAACGLMEGNLSESLNIASQMTLGSFPAIVSFPYVSEKAKSLMNFSTSENSKTEEEPGFNGNLEKLLKD